MDHLAIMKKSWGLIPKILSGEKTIESRWYQTKRAPWNKVSIGDTIYFKNTGEPVIAKATISEVMQFEITGISDVADIVKKYGTKICLVNKDPNTWGKISKYCILLLLQNPEIVSTPFHINKKGFGSGAAWITVGSISMIKGQFANR